MAMQILEIKPGEYQLPEQDRQSLISSPEEFVSDERLAVVELQRRAFVERHGGDGLQDSDPGTKNFCSKTF